jgi:crotonobetainyl-CoA:carnitine CoA-transferase CaiB-like acyl-CoA transferase
VHGIRVLDLSSDDAGAFCTRMLATAGAEVTVLEPEEGHPLRQDQPLLADGTSVAWEYLQANKTLHSGQASQAGHSGLDEVELAAGYDVVVFSDEVPDPDLAARIEALREAHPQQVVVVITGFGLRGSRADWRAGPLEHWASSGMMSLNGERDREPLPGGGRWVTRIVGAIAAIGAQAAVINAAMSGSGDVVDVDVMQALAASHQWSIVLYTHQGVLKERSGNRHGEAHHPLSIHPCSDGWVCIAAVARHQWEGLCIAIDQVELLADDELYTPAVRFDRADELDALIDGWTSQRTVEDVVTTLQAQQTPAGAVSSLQDTLADPQLDARDFWARPVPERPNLVMPAVPFRIPGATPAFRAAPRVPQSGAVDSSEPGLPMAGAKARPLAGVRVVEFSIAFAGPLVGRFLADLGADVIKVEHPTSRGLAMPDPEQMASEASSWSRGELPGPLSRNGIFPDNDPGAAWWNRMGIWNKMNRGKRSLCLDVKAPGGRDVLERLVAESDVVFNNYSPRGVRSLEIDHETLRAIKPDLVTLDLSGYGATGPDEHKVSWGPILDASSGLASTTGYRDSGPYKQGLALPDACGGVLGTVALLGALWQRWASGLPVHVDLSQLETFLTLGGDQVLEASDTGNQASRVGARSRFDAPTGVYRCAGDDAWAVLSVRSDNDWRRLVAVIGDLGQQRWDDVGDRLDDHDAIDDVITGWTTQHSKHEVMTTLQEAGIAASAVMTNVDLFHDTHLAERSFFVELDQQDCGPQTFPGFPINFETTPVELRPAPGLGAHNATILAELGYSPSDVAALVTSTALASEPPG